MTNSCSSLITDYVIGFRGAKAVWTETKDSILLVDTINVTVC